MPHGKIKKAAQAAAVFLAFLALVFVSALVTMKVVTSGRTVVVPDVSGEELAAAINTLKEDGLEIKVDREEFHPTAPEGTVVSQTPLPGSTVKKGRNISVVVSLGRQEITVPDLYGETFRRAQIILKQAGLTLGEVARASSPEPRETVAAQDPAAQRVVQRGGALDLLVSTGPAPEKYIAPDLTGKTLPEAEAVARSLAVGLMPSGRTGVVVSQEPPAGYPLLAGEVVKVALGTGAQAPAAQPPASKPGTKPGQPVPGKGAQPGQAPAPKPAPAAQPPAPAAEPAAQKPAEAPAPAKKPVRQPIRDPLGGRE